MDKVSSSPPTGAASADHGSLTRPRSNSNIAVERPVTKPDSNTFQQTSDIIREATAHSKEPKLPKVSTLPKKILKSTKGEYSLTSQPKAKPDTVKGISITPLGDKPAPPPEYSQIDPSINDGSQGDGANRTEHSTSVDRGASNRAPSSGPGMWGRFFGRVPTEPPRYDPCPVELPSNGNGASATNLSTRLFENNLLGRIIGNVNRSANRVPQVPPERLPPHYSPEDPLPETNPPKYEEE